MHAGNVLTALCVHIHKLCLRGRRFKSKMIKRVIYKIFSAYKTTSAATTKSTTKPKNTVVKKKTTTVTTTTKAKDVVSANWHDETASLFAFEAEQPTKKPKKAATIQTTKEVVQEIMKEEKKAASKEQVEEAIKEPAVEAKLTQNLNKDRSAELLKYADEFKAEDMEKQRKTAKKFKRWFEIMDVNESLLETNMIKDYPIIGPDGVDNYRHLYTEENISLLNKSLFAVKDKFRDELPKLKTPSLSTIIDISEAPEKRKGLYKWKATKRLELGKEGFEKLQFDITNKGERYHSAVESLAKGTPYADIQVNEDLKEAWSSLQSLLTVDFGQTLLTECPVRHEKLAYQGRFDAISFYKGNVYLVDWKLTEKRKEGLYDYPLQLVAYLGAFLHDPNFAELRKKNEIRNVMVVFAYLNGSPPSVFCLTFHQILYYWVRWLERVQKFWLNVRVLNKI